MEKYHHTLDGIYVSNVNRVKWKIITYLSAFKKYQWNQNHTWVKILARKMIIRVSICHSINWQIGTRKLRSQNKSTVEKSNDIFFETIHVFLWHYIYWSLQALRSSWCFPIVKCFQNEVKWIRSIINIWQMFECHIQCNFILMFEL